MEKGHAFAFVARKKRGKICSGSKCCWYHTLNCLGIMATFVMVHSRYVIIKIQFCK